MMARNREWSAVGSLVDAARAGSIDDVRRALVAGADINALGGFTALSAACSSNHFNVVQFLVSRGAGVNILDGYGRSPLCCAALSARNTVILEFLLQHGADPRVCSSSVVVVTLEYFNHMCRTTVLCWRCAVGVRPCTIQHSC